MHKNSNEKLDAIKYEVKNLKSVCSIGVQSASGFDAQQAFLHVCADMNGLGDWLSNEHRCTKEDWIKMVKSSTDLFIVCKIDTKNKHGATDAPMWQLKANKIDTTQGFLIKVPGGLTKNITSVIPKHFITVDGKEYDAVDLAIGALNDIKTFVSQLP